MGSLYGHGPRWLLIAGQSTEVPETDGPKENGREFCSLARPCQKKNQKRRTIPRTEDKGSPIVVCLPQCPRASLKGKLFQP